MDINSELESRIESLQDKIERAGLKGMLVSGRENVSYLTGKEAGRLLVTRDGAILWVKDLYKKLYSNLYSSRGYPVDVRVYGNDSVKKFISKRNINRLAVDNRSHTSYVALKRELKVRVAVKDYVEASRAVKSGREIALIKKSCGIASEGMRAAQSLVRMGVREIDAVADVERVIRSLGSETPPFNDGMLLASGRRSADIHSTASKARMGRGLVVVDLGAKYGGYYSDMTRTLMLGRLTRREELLSEFVTALKDETIDSIKAGALAGEVHSGVEKRLRKVNQRFYHSTGHGVGLQIHELPNIGPESKDVLEEGMVFTIEPGVYLPGRFGVRFEDTVLLTKKGCVRLTR